MQIKKRSSSPVTAAIREEEETQLDIKFKVEHQDEVAPSSAAKAAGDPAGRRLRVEKV